MFVDVIISICTIRVFEYSSGSSNIAGGCFIDRAFEIWQLVANVENLKFNWGERSGKMYRTIILTRHGEVWAS